MPRLRTYKTEGVVLKQTPLGEADRILTMLTPDRGKLRAVARGVRRPRSRLGGHLDLLNRVSISLSEGRSLDAVTEAETLRSFRLLREDLERVSRALYMAELADAFSVENAPGPEMYRLLLDSLGWLECTARPGLLLRRYEVRLLEHSGYRPELYSCVECGSSLEPGDHAFSSAVGGVLCPECRAGAARSVVPVSKNCIKVLRFLQREDRSERVESLRVSDGMLRELERLLRSYLRYVVERELRSAEFVHLVST